MVSDQNRHRIDAAKQLMDPGDYSAASRRLTELVEQKVPEALFLASTFSTSSSESDEQFERRSLEMLRESANLGYLPAMYALANCYEVGDLVEQDSAAAMLWYKRASEGGDDRAKFRYGLALLSGVGGTQDALLGTKLINEAADAGVEGASEALEDELRK